LAEVAIPRGLYRAILRRIRRFAAICPRGGIQAVAGAERLGFFGGMIYSFPRDPAV